MAKNLTLNKLRSSRRINELPLNPEINFDGFSQDLERFETRESINDAINRLNEQDRELVVRRFILGDQVKSLAERFRLNQNTVATRLARARKKLAHFLKEGEG